MACSFLFTTIAVVGLLATCQAASKMSGKIRCNGDDSDCPENMVCTGNDIVKRCVSSMILGTGCGRTAFQVCERHLDCIRYKCLKPIKKGGDCLQPFAYCQDDNVCFGLDEEKRCVTRIEEGRRCDLKGFSICVEGFDCVRGRCRLPLIKEGRSCLAKDSECEEGTVCAGTEEKKRCVVPMKEGQKCRRDPFWVCEKRFECYKGMCVPPSIKKNHSCVQKGARCVEGTVCAGLANRKRCVVPMKENERCRKDPFWICEDKLECVKGVCLPPAIKKGRSCVKKGSRCTDGTVCAGRKGHKKCVVPMKEGGNCRKDPFWVCVEGLDCYKGTCVQPPIKKGCSCVKKGSRCIDGTVCAGVRKRKRCVVPMKKGQHCRKDPFWVCLEGLQCVKGTCALP